MNYMVQKILESKQIRIYSMCSSSDRFGNVQNHVTLNVKFICQGDTYGSRLNEFLDPLNIGNKKDHEDSMLRSRYTPNDDIGHEFDAMTSPK